METSVVLQDPAFTALTGRSSAPAGAGAETSALFASTLQLELDAPLTTAADSSSGLPTTQKLRSELSDWLRSLPGIKGAATVAPSPTEEVVTTTESASDDELQALPLVNLFSSSATFNPLPDESAPTEAEDDVATALGKPLIDGLLVLQPESGTATGAAVPPAAVTPNPAMDPAALNPPAIQVPASNRTTTTAHTAAELQPLPVTAREARAAGQPATETSHSRDSAYGAPPILAAESSNLLTGSTSKPGMDELLQALQGSTTDATARFASPQSVLAPEADAGFMQQALALTALRQGDNTAAPASVHNSSAAEGLFTLTTETPAGAEGWGEEIGSHISWLSEQKISKAELTLHPAELGVLDITINNEDERVTVSIVTRNEAARELLQEHLPRLADLLRQNGLALEQGSVSQHSAGQRDEQSSNAQARTGATPEVADEAAGTPVRRSRAALLHQGQIDHYV